MMKFSSLDRRMRIYETSSDLCVMPGLFMVARLDGRNFTTLTKDRAQFEAPFDVRFRDLMIETTQALMTCGFRVLFGFTESDEISLLLGTEEKIFGRKLRKYNSILAGEASAQFSMKLGQVATFDCRVSQLPTEQLVVDYFRWRSTDAGRNALTSWCYWTLRKDGLTPQQANRRLLGISVSDKNELLFQYGINFNDLPAWQKRGVGLYWETYEKTATNPLTGESTQALRKRIRTETELPMKGQFDAFLRQRITQENE